MKPKMIIVRKWKKHGEHEENHYDEHHRKEYSEKHHHYHDDKELEREYQKSRKEFITDTLEAIQGYKD